MGLHFTAKIIGCATGIRQTKKMSIGKTYDGYCLNYLTPNSYLDICGKSMQIKSVSPEKGSFAVETNMAKLNLYIKDWT